MFTLARACRSLLPFLLLLLAPPSD